MLLRTVGIPARYVTGYSVSGGAGQWNEVTEDDAHAWVEYYVAGQGWLPLDPTPAVEEPNEPVTEPEQEEPPAEQELPQQLEQQTEQAEAVTQTAPGTTVVSDNTLPEKSCVELPRELLWLLTVPGLALLICLRRWFGLRYRRERCTKGHPNRRALTWWRWLVHLSKVGSRVIPEELLCLAEKARFSQHTMTEEELAKLQGAVEARIEELRQAPAGRRLWHQYGLVLY